MVNHTRHTKKQNGGEGNRSKIVMDAILEKLQMVEPKKKVEIIEALIKSKNHTDFNIEDFKNEIIHNTTNKINETKFDELWEKIRSRDNKGDKFLKYYLNIFRKQAKGQKSTAETENLQKNVNAKIEYLKIQAEKNKETNPYNETSENILKLDLITKLQDDDKKERDILNLLTKASYSVKKFHEGSRQRQIDNDNIDTHKINDIKELKINGTTLIHQIIYGFLFDLSNLNHFRKKEIEQAKKNQIQKTSQVEIQTPSKQKNPQNTCVEEEHSKFDDLNDEEKKLVHNETDRAKAHDLLENDNKFLIRKSISPQDSITLVKKISDTKFEDIKICKGKYDNKLYTISATGKNQYNNLNELVEDYSSKNYTFVNPKSKGVLRRRGNQVHRGRLTRPKKQIYVLVFDYDHTLTNSYGNDNDNHSNGHSWHNDEKLNPKFKQEINKSIYDATEELKKTRGDYAKLKNQLCTLKENGVLMFVNSRGIQEQLVERLKADKLSEFFGIDDGSAENEMMEFEKEIVAKGNIGNGIYGAFGTRESNTIGRRDWHKIKLQVIERILEQLKTKNKINDNVEVHFFDDEDANVEAFNTKFIENIKNRVGHLIGKRGREERNSITQELEDFITKTLQKTLQECPAHTALTAGGYRKTLHKSKKSRKSKKTKKSSRKTSKKH